MQFWQRFWAAVKGNGGFRETVRRLCLVTLGLHRDDEFMLEGRWICEVWFIDGGVGQIPRVMEIERDEGEALAKRKSVGYHPGHRQLGDGWSSYGEVWLQAARDAIFLMMASCDRSRKTLTWCLQNEAEYHPYFHAAHASESEGWRS